MVKKKSMHGFWKRIHFKYRLSAMNENTLEEVWKIRASIFTGIILFLIVAAIVVFITSVIIIATPIRYYLPGYLDSEVRESAVRNALVADSLEYKLWAQEQYAYNVRKILNGSMDPDSVAALPDTIRVSEDNKALQKSEAEKQFVQRYEEEEKYNLSVLPTSASNESFILYNPVNGIITSKFNAAREQFGIEIQGNGKATVSAVLEGTVVGASYDVTDGYVIQIQHKIGLLSIYKHCTGLLKKVGDEVRQGEAIAVLGTKTIRDKSEPASLEFEIWYNGLPVDPEDYMTF